MKSLIITIEKTSTGLSAYANDYPGIATVGDDFHELKENIREVVEAEADYLKETGNENEAEELKNASIEFAVDFKQFFEYFSMINKTEFAKYIGINPSLFRQYTRKIVPISDRRMAEIEKGIHRLAKDLSEINFA